MSNEAKVLEFLYKNPEKGYNINQIARLIGISVGSVFKILKIMEKRAYVISYKEKNALIYRINLTDKTKEIYYKLVIDKKKHRPKKTKIIATLGPSSSNPVILRGLIRKGVNCIRINACHSNENSALELVKSVRSVSTEIPILLDIPGPKIRLNNITSPISVEKDNVLVFSFVRRKNPLFVDSPLYKYVKSGHHILIDDGKLELVVIEINSRIMKCKALNSWTITKNKGINFPDSFLDYSTISDIDKKWIYFAIKYDLDFIGISFVNSPEDIININKILGYDTIKKVIGDKIKVIAKIETKEAIKNYRSIISEAYGIMIDRGDLASETRFEVVPKLQKEIIRECNNQGKPVIIATQMLDTMVNSLMPTKAEISDIANAILDGASCLMLSAETAIGNYPVESVEVVSKIAREVEGERSTNHVDFGQGGITDSICKAILGINRELNIDAIIVITSGGYTARILSSKNMEPKIIALTTKKKIARQMNILWGVHPLVFEGNLKEITESEKINAITAPLNLGLVNKTDHVILTGSVFHSKSKRTNMLEVHKVEEFLDYLSKNDRR